MEFKDALKSLRSELAITQVELANILHINSVTVSRWEIGKSFPNRSASIALLEYAGENSASGDCLDALKRSIAKVSKQRLDGIANSSHAVVNPALCQLIDDASFPLYICDMNTDELLYINRKAEELLGGRLDELVNKKCYVCLMRRDAPCEFCHKERLTTDKFTSFDAFRPDDHSYHRVRGKLITWNGRKAQARFILDMAGTINVSSRREREILYHEQLRVRREHVVNAVATARFNLTHNTISDVTSKKMAIAALIKRHTIDEILLALTDGPFSGEDGSALQSVRDREAMIKQFYEGKTHISVKHYSKRFKSYFESTFDLMQNPVTYDIEALAALWDITDATLTNDIAKRLFSIDYETIIVIDAETGEPRPYIGDHIDDVVFEQDQAGDSVAGVEAYLRKYCADDDIESVVRETSLPYVKEQLKTKPYHHTAYTLRIDDKLIYKRTMYTYLDKQKTIILCAMQNMSDIRGRGSASHARDSEQTITRSAINQ